MPAGRTQFRGPSKQKDLRLGTWKVLLLYRTGALRNLVDVLKTYEIDILAVQETTWIGQNILERKDCTVYYSCHDETHHFGTGFVPVATTLNTTPPRRLCLRKTRKLIVEHFLYCAGIATTLIF
jgi:hypothetical protein